MTYCIAVLEAEIKVLDVKLQIREDELPQFKDTSMLAVRKNEDIERTSSRIFFQMMRVISSPSSSTIGFFTTIFSSM